MTATTAVEAQHSHAKCTAAAVAQEGSGTHFGPRGRSSRRRSSASDGYVCVIAWIVRAPPAAASSPDSMVQLTKAQSDDEAKRDTLLANVQEIRRRFDAAYSRWEPHVTFIPPFMVPFRRPRGTPSQQSKGGEGSNNDNRKDNSKEMLCEPTRGATTASRQHPNQRDPLQDLAKLAERIEGVCAQLRLGDEKAQNSTTIAFDHINQFSLRRYKTVHLRPPSADDGAAVLAQLQTDLSLALPEAFENSRNAMTRKEFSASSNTVFAVATAEQHQQHQQYQQQQQPPMPPRKGTQTFTPHLTLGQASNAQKETELMEALQALGLKEGATCMAASTGNARDTPSCDFSTPAAPQTSPPLDVPIMLATPLRVRFDAIQLLYKPAGRSGPYDVYREFSMSRTAGGTMNPFA